MRWFPLILIFGAAFVAAQNTPASPPTGAAPADADQKKIRVEGTILSLNGEVIRKATVRLQGTPTQPGQGPAVYSEATDNAGKFVFEDAVPGRYTLSAEKAGFVTARYGARSATTPGTQLTLVAGMEMKDLAINMTPQGVIVGKVVDQDGDPVASVQVQAMRSSYARGRKQLQPTGGAATNDLGEYRIGNLAPGRYFLNATDRRVQILGTQERPGRAGAAQEGNITTYYPNGADASGGVPIDVTAGGEIRGMDIRMLRGKVYTVRGKAVFPSGPPGQVAAYFSRKDDGGNSLAALNGGSITQLRPDGAFELRSVAPGTYVLRILQVIANGNQPANLTGRVEVTVADSNIDDLVLPVGPAAEITGTVRLEDGDITTLLKPAQSPAGTGAAGPAFLLGRFTLALGEIEGASPGGASVQVKDDGTFRFINVGTAKYALNVISPPQGTYLKSASFGGQDVTHAIIDTTSGAGGTLGLVLSSKAASVAGSVQSEKGEPLAGVMVTLWPKTPDASLTGGTRASFTDQNGGFQFQGLAPNDYYVAAWEDLEQGLAQSSDFLSQFTSEASSIKLAEGGQESRNLKPVPADKIALEIAKLP